MTRAALVFAALLLCGCASGRRESVTSPESYEPRFPYRFEGNAGVEKEDLIDAARIELASFETRGRHPADLDDAAYAMRRTLRREGYAHAKVVVLPEPSPENAQSVTFRIEEGPTTRWGTISFPGATLHGEAHLRKFFVPAPKKRGLVGPEEEPPPFRATELDAGIGRVEGLYLGDGYNGVKVGPPKIAWSEDRTVADVTIPVVEGPRHLVRGVTIVMEGGAAAPAELTAAVRPFEGTPYHPRITARVSAAIRGVLASQGRILADVEPAVKIDRAAAMADVKVAVRTGPQLRIAAVDIQGNERTRNWFMRQRARLRPGELMTADRLDEARSELYGTGLFKSVRVEPVVPPGTESRPSEDSYDAAVAIAVEELRARTIDFEVGWGSYELLRGAVRYRDRNLFGIGRDFEVEPAASTKSLGADVRFFDRYILGNRNTVEVIAGVLQRQEPSFDLFTYRLEAAVRRRFTDRLMGRAGFRFVKSNATDVRVDDDLPRETTITSGPFVQLEYDGRDNPILPTRGYHVDVGSALSASALGANLDFADLYAAGSVYFPLAEDLVLGVAARGQTRPTLDGSPTLPIQERLFLGGANNVRSFGEDELGPIDADGDPIGGLTTFDATIELRQRLYGELHGAVFYDVGSVGERAFDVGAFGHAVGVGLRYYLPMGPVRLDVGFNPGRRFGADSDVAVHFSFGFSF
jgi:outer membrane protein assembly complex protein YaeT